MNIQKRVRVQRDRRRSSVRRRIRAVSDRPRLSVFRSCKHIYAQVVDDAAGRTLCSFGTSGKAAGSELAGKNKTEKARFVGAEIARRAVGAGVTQVVFDRGDAKYTGRIRALADAAREAGLKF